MINQITNNGLSTFNPAISVKGFSAIALTTFVVQLLSNMPITKAMDETGLKVCQNMCHQKYAGSELERCLQRCWNTYVSSSGDC